jgi:hypothetical protein
MTVLAHIMGIPVEEFLVPLAGVGTGAVLWLAALLSPVVRKRRH